ncbi:early nodulin-93-like [Lotus japonicus]|uniref:early nodulin-93-like n=1 Tax=Lotus japonicus TaxID=34305 RepID=UPI00258C5E02|nr:early nodulin-93-like [Lotus japonicus]
MPATSGTLHPKPFQEYHLFTKTPSNSITSFCSIKSLKMATKKNITANSPLERTSLPSLDQRLAMAKHCSHEGVMAGAKAAVVASIATAIPTLASVRMLPWARANLNHTAQALIISTVAGAAYFIVADKTVLATARKNSFKNLHNA